MNMEPQLELLKQELLTVFGGGADARSKRTEQIRESFENLDEEFRCVMERYLEVNVKEGVTIREMAQAYVFFLAENDKEEKYFFEHGKYRYSRLAEVLAKVYDNAEYMQKYMLGLAVSMIIWPQHREYFRFFSSFIDKCRSYEGEYLEVGAGHGLFVSEALRRGNFSRYDVLDISEKSLELTSRMLAGFSEGKCVNYVHKDFLEYKGESYDVISIGEVLEHVEEPGRFLQKCRELISTDGRIYLTTCINAPEIDHIYLFASVEEIEELFEEAGLEIVERLYLPYRGYALERCKRQQLPVNVAYVLKRN